MLILDPAAVENTSGIVDSMLQFFVHCVPTVLTCIMQHAQQWRLTTKGGMLQGI